MNCPRKVELNRYRALVAYDGTDFQGFQRLSPGARSVQGTLEAALKGLSGIETIVLGAGRTDAGVHATGQVISFEVAWRHSTESLTRALNALLPTDIAVREVEQTVPTFHPRYDALSRVYVYRVYVSEVRVPLLARTAWHLRATPDWEIMNRAAAMLIGSHDFASFGNPPRGERGTTYRHLMQAAWAEAPAQFGAKMAIFTVEANAFLYRMVRTLTGALVEIGTGRLSLNEFDGIFRARDRGLIGALAPAHGLTLVEVKYARETPAENTEKD